MLMVNFGKKTENAHLSSTRVGFTSQIMAVSMNFIITELLVVRDLLLRNW